MQSEINRDADKLSTELTLLKEKFDEAIRHGHVFANVKTIYLRIKQIEQILQRTNGVNYTNGQGN